MPPGILPSVAFPLRAKARSLHATYYKVTTDTDGLGFGVIPAIVAIVLLISVFFLRRQP